MYKIRTYSFFADSSLVGCDLKLKAKMINGHMTATCIILQDTSEEWLREVEAWQPKHRWCSTYSPILEQ